MYQRFQNGETPQFARTRIRYKECEELLSERIRILELIDSANQRKQDDSAALHSPRTSPSLRRRWRGRGRREHSTPRLLSWPRKRKRTPTLDDGYCCCDFGCRKMSLRFVRDVESEASSLVLVSKILEKERQKYAIYIRLLYMWERWTHIKLIGNVYIKYYFILRWHKWYLIYFIHICVSIMSHGQF